MRHVLIVSAASLLLYGCGGSSTPPTPVPTGLTVSAPEGVLFLGQNYPFTATLQLSNGTSNVVTGTWGSDAPSVATVQASTGQVQIVGVGEATIFVDAQGLRGTRRIRATVNYAGEIEGGLRVTGCSETGIFAQSDACDEARNGTVFQFLGEFTQNEETVVATMDLVEWPADPVTATLTGAGELRFTSDHRSIEEGFEAVATAQWVFRPDGPSQIQGTAVWRMRIVGLSGVWEIRGTILPLTRSMTGSEPSGARSVGDVLRRLRR